MLGDDKSVRRALDLAEFRGPCHPDQRHLGRLGRPGAMSLVSWRVLFVTRDVSHHPVVHDSLCAGRRWGSSCGMELTS